MVEKQEALFRYYHGIVSIIVLLKPSLYYDGSRSRSGHKWCCLNGPGSWALWWQVIASKLRPCSASMPTENTALVMPELPALEESVIMISLCKSDIKKEW